MAYSNLVSAPVPFGFRSYSDLVGVGTRGFGDYGLGARAWQLEGLIFIIYLVNKKRRNVNIIQTI